MIDLSLINFKQYKATDQYMCAHQGGRYQYEMLKWTPSLVPEICRSGYHTANGRFIFMWLGSGRIFEAATMGLSMTDTNKTAWETICLVREVGLLEKHYDEFYAWLQANVAVRDTDNRLERTRRKIQGDPWYQDRNISSMTRRLTRIGELIPAALCSVNSLADVISAEFLIARWMDEHFITMEHGEVYD